MLKDNYACDGQMSIFDYMAAANEKQVELPDPEGLPKDICQFSQHKCNKAELWRVADELDELQCPHVCCRRCNTRLCGARCNGSEEPQKAGDTVKMWDRDWYSFEVNPKDKGITEYDQLEVTGPYTYNDKEHWSVCQASLEGDKVVALDVPWDIPRPQWKYWRLRYKIYPVVIKGLCDDAYCPNCGRGFMDPMENDLSECPLCHTKVNWEPWHKANDNEEIFDDEAE